MSQNVDFDPFCDPDKPKKISFEDISAAAYRIKSGVIVTPCMKSRMSEDFNMNIYIKCEFFQTTGSFKERGARNSMLLLDAESKKRGVIASSLGNHSQGMSYHGTDLGIPTTVIMPVCAPLMKIQKCKQYGANVILHGANLKDAKHHALVLAKEKNLTYINGYDHPAILSGQGTVGLEILEQVPNVDAVLVPCGGGGLLAGIAVAIKHLKPTCRIYGVETDQCDSMSEAFKQGKPVFREIITTIADGLAVATVGVNSYLNCKDNVDSMITVTEDWTARSILRMVEQEKFVVEGGGAVTTAAIMAGLVPELQGKNVVCIASGGNIDTTLLSHCLDRGLVGENRLVQFQVGLSDRPGSITELCRIVGDIGVSIKEIVQQSAWLTKNMFKILTILICEIREPAHLQQLREVIVKTYGESNVSFPNLGFEPGAAGGSRLKLRKSIIQTE